MYQLAHQKFPKGFILGVADADLQVMGEKYCVEEEGSEPSVWTHFAKASGKVYGNQTPEEGVDRFHRWKEDIGLITTLGVKHYRTSVSLCRTLHPDGSVNEKAIAWYREYFTALRAQGLKLYITLYHWELPQWLHERGGWKNREITDILVHHALVVQERLGDLIDEYFILNEPYQFTLLSYHLGEHAPGETDLRGALLAVHHAMLAQGKVCRALKAKDASIKIGTTYNSRVFYSLSTDEQDLQATTLAADYQTRIFLEPLYKGQYPEEFQRRFKDIWPVAEKGDMETMCVGKELHAFGLNFYRGMVIRADASSELGFKEVQFPQGVKNGLGWPVYVQPTYPEGLYDLLRSLYAEYHAHGMKQIYLTENGACWDDRVDAAGKVHDDFRIYFLREHLSQILKAILAGVPVASYFVWTLLDNYEWDLGFKPGSNFGIVHVDRHTMQRIPKDSFSWFKNVVETRSLD